MGRWRWTNTGQSDGSVRQRSAAQADSVGDNVAATTGGCALCLGSGWHAAPQPAARARPCPHQHISFFFFSVGFFLTFFPYPLVVSLGFVFSSPLFSGGEIWLQSVILASFLFSVGPLSRLWLQSVAKKLRPPTSISSLFSFSAYPLVCFLACGRLCTDGESRGYQRRGNPFPWLALLLIF